MQDQICRTGCVHACRAMATVLRQGREIALELVTDAPGRNSLAGEALSKEEAALEDERQFGALKARKLDCRVRISPRLHACCC